MKRTEGVVSAILRRMRAEGGKVRGCSYGGHPFVRYASEPENRMMICTACDAVYSCTDATWEILPAAPEPPVIVN